MRFFITSYQKAGTHQIMPAFGAVEQIVGRAFVDMANVKGYGQRCLNRDGIQVTCKKLREFKEPSFGHLPYLPEYAEAIQATPTKVLFNVRDPRDVVIANLYSIRKVYHRTDPPGGKGLGHLNMRNDKTERLLIEMDDPISELIKIESQRWPKWLGWLDHDFVMQVKYEDLRTDGVETLRKVLDFTLPYSFNIYSVGGNLKPQHSNPTFRAGRIGDWKNEFSAKHKRLAEKLMGETITRLGYEL